MKTIFVVDDNETNLMVAKLALDPSYMAFALPSAAGIFRLARKLTPDLVLLDIEMPEMDGFEALKLMRADDKLRTTPVIFLTGRADPDLDTRVRGLGALDLIHKPFSAPDLLKRIEAHIGV